MPKTRSLHTLTLVLYAFATLQFVRFYVVSTHFYLNMPAYLRGQERLPFQERVLPIFLMWPINHSAYLMHAVAGRHSTEYGGTAATPETLAFYLISLLSFAVAGLYSVRLYRAVTSSGLLEPLVYPLLMIVALWTYVVHVDANYSYPYDMPSLAFFAAGLFYIYLRRFAPLLIVILLGTLNRETTLFLIGLYLIDAASEPVPDPATPFRQRFQWRGLPWSRAALLLGIWGAIRLTLAVHFAGNSHAELYNRVLENLFRLKPRLLPSLLNICGYLLPVVLLFRHRLAPVRFANYLYILPFWFAVMFYSGVILETRIYGELCPYVSVAAVLLLESQVLQPAREPLLSRSGRPLRRRKTDVPLPSRELVTD